MEAGCSGLDREAEGGGRQQRPLYQAGRQEFRWCYCVHQGSQILLEPAYSKRNVLKEKKMHTNLTLRTLFFE